MVAVCVYHDRTNPYIQLHYAGAPTLPREAGGNAQNPGDDLSKPSSAQSLPIVHWRDTPGVDGGLRGVQNTAHDHSFLYNYVRRPCMLHTHSCRMSVCILACGGL